MSNRGPEIQLKLELAELRDLIEDARCDLKQLPPSLVDEVQKFQKRIDELEFEVLRLELDGQQPS